MEFLPYLVATPALQQRLCLAPLGHSFAAQRIFDPMRRASAPFLDRLEQLDAATFGREGMAMPRWAFYDCAELPGAVLGLAARAAEVPEELRSNFGKVSDAELVPLSMYMAIPTLTEHEWLGFSLCAFDVAAAFLGAAIDVATLALSVATLRARQVTGTVQWGSRHLSATARFAPLSVLAAHLPAHTRAATCVFRFEANAACIERALADTPPILGDIQWLAAGDTQMHQAAQMRIEAGQRASIVGQPETRDGSQHIPLHWEAAP
ncbi:MAG TPA: hypothetical protein PKD61_00865 [Polyangiaceae bacterium]|nr:hypothetical protein [Polyangiaceae bacterium]